MVYYRINVVISDKMYFKANYTITVQINKKNLLCMSILGWG